MSCERFRSELMDLALGAAASAEVEKHTASCPSCGQALATMRARVSLMDEELGLAGAAEPGPHFLSRVRGRIAADRASRRPSAMRLLLPVTASLAAAVLGLLLLRRPPAEHAAQAASVARPEPTAAEAAAAPPSPGLAKPVAAARPVRSRTAGPAVLADPAESAALADLAARLGSGRTRPDALQLPEADPNGMKEIAIAPLDVRPLDAAPSLEDSTERSPS